MVASGSFLVLLQWKTHALYFSDCFVDTFFRVCIRRCVVSFVFVVPVDAI
jgi:hypothetical protein